MVSEGPNGKVDVDEAPKEVTDWRLVLRRQLSVMVERNAEHSAWTNDHDDDTITLRTNEMGRLLDQFRQLLIEDPTAALEMQSELVKKQNHTDDLIKRRLRTTQLNVPASTSDDRRPSSSSTATNTDPITAASLATVDARSTKSLVTTTSNCGVEDRVEERKYEASSGQPATTTCRSFRFRRLWLSRIVFGKDDNNTAYRDLWSSQVEFFLSCLGFMVGIGNIWRFPSKVYLHGGGAFLIPYFVSLLGLGLPIVYLHLCLGQYSGLSAGSVFTKMMPLGSGIGWTLVVGAVPLCIYYNITVAWGLYYLWYSLSGFVSSNWSLPWAKCAPEWVQKYNCCDLHGDSACFANNYSMTSAEAFFHFQMLNRTEVGNIGSTLLNGTVVSQAELGPLQGHIVLALTVAWILTFFCVFHGIGSIGWAVYLTTTVPYLMLIILLFRGLSLEGASEGVQYFLKPDLTKIWKSEVWKSAAEQAFYSLGIDAGPLITMASYSRFRNNVYRDGLLLVTFDTLTSILCGCVIFSFIGFLAQQQGKDIKDLLQHDSLYLAFTAYPGVTSYLEMGPLWAALFFAMVILAAMDAQFAWIEMISSSLLEKAGKRRSQLETKIIVALCIFCFLCGLPFCARGGIFIFHAIENFSGNWFAFTLTLAQVIVVSYVYGVDRFLEDIGRMQYFKPKKIPNTTMSPSTWLQQVGTFFGPTGPYIKWSWLIFSPLILICLLAASVTTYEPVTFNQIVLPYGYEMVAWIVMVGPLIVIPLVAIYFYQYAKANGKPMSWLFTSEEWCKIRTPDDMVEYDAKEVKQAMPANEHIYKNRAFESSSSSSSEEDEQPIWLSSAHSSTTQSNHSLQLRSVSDYASSAGHASFETNSMELSILNALHSAQSMPSINSSGIDSGGSNILRPGAIRLYMRNPRTLSRPVSAASSSVGFVGRRIAPSNTNNDQLPLSPFWQANSAKRPRTPSTAATASNPFQPPLRPCLFGAPPVVATSSDDASRKSILETRRPLASITRIERNVAVGRRYSPEGHSMPPEATQLRTRGGRVSSVNGALGQPPPMLVAPIDQTNNQLSNLEATAVEQSAINGGNDE